MPEGDFVKLQKCDMFIFAIDCKNELFQTLTGKSSQKRDDFPVVSDTRSRWLIRRKRKMKRGKVLKILTRINVKH